MHLYVTQDSPHRWFSIDSEQNAIVDSGQEDSLAQIPLNKNINRIIMILNGTSVTSHKVTVPGVSRKKVISAIPFVLEEELTDDIEDLHFALQHWAPDEPAQVLVVKDEIIQNSLEEASDSGLDIDDFVPEYLLLPQHPSTDVTLAKNTRGEFVIRSAEGAGTVVDENMIELWWEMESQGKNIAINDEHIVKDLIAQGGENIQFWDIGDSVEKWIRHGSLSKLITPCLLQGKYDDTGKKQKRFDYKMAANFMLAGVAIYIGSLLLNHFYLGYKLKNLDSEAVEIFETAFPELKDQTIEDPVFEMRKGISALKSGNYQSDNFLSIFQVVANQLKVAPNTTLTNLIFEDDVLKAQVTVPDFAALDALYLKLATVTQGYATVDTKDAAAQDEIVKGVLEVTLKEG